MALEIPTEAEPPSEQSGISAQVFRALFEKMPDAALILDAHGRVADLNASARRLLGGAQAGPGPQDMAQLAAAGFQPLAAFLEQAGAAGGEQHAVCWLPRGPECQRKYDCSAVANFFPGLQLVLLHALPEPTEAAEPSRGQPPAFPTPESFQLFSDYTVDWDYWIAPDGSLLYNSPSCQHLTGWAAAELMQDPALLVKIVHPAERELMERHLREKLGSPEACALEFRIVTAAGQERWVGHVCQPIYAADGRHLGRRASNRDITPMKQAEDTLRYQAALFMSSTDAVVVSDQNYRITAWNPAAEQMYGWKAEEVLGRSGLEIIQTVFPEPDKAAMMDMIARTGFYRGEATQARKDGTRFPVDLGSVVLHDDSGRISGYLSVNRDVTERKRIEAELIKSEERFRSSIENMMDAFGIYSAVRDEQGTITDFRIEYVNAAACQITRRTSSQQVGHNLLQVLPAFRLTGLFEDYCRVTATGEPVVKNVQIAAKGPAGDNLLLAFDVQVARLGDGVIASWREVTERLLAEQAIQKLNQDLTRQTEQLMDANKELEAFSYTVSHDLRGPLRGIQSFTQILLSEFAGQLPPEMQHCLEIIELSSQKMARLIDDLLAFSRLSRQELDVRPLDLQLLAREVLQDLAYESQGRRVELQISDMPVCRADPAMMRQVLANLLSNALKYTRKQTEARIQLGSLQRGGELIYYVKDNGVGFNMRYVDKIFMVFQRLHDAEDYEGTGVGLAIAQRILLRHGGRIWAESQEGQGATFYFTLPPPAARMGEPGCVETAAVYSAVLSEPGGFQIGFGRGSHEPGCTNLVSRR